MKLQYIEWKCSNNGFFRYLLLMETLCFFALDLKWVLLSTRLNRKWEEFILTDIAILKVLCKENECGMFCVSDSNLEKGCNLILTEQ